MELTPIPHLRVLPGVRIDYTQLTDRWTVDPRVSIRYDVFAGFPRTTLKGGAGIYGEPPQPEQAIAPFGTPHLYAERAAHYSLGVEQEFTRYLDVSIEGFFRDTSRMVQAYATTTTTYGIAYNNLGTGRAYGLEVLLRYKPDEHFFGWIAYTLSRSEVKPTPGAPWQLFDYDQTHILTILASYKLPKDWQVGLRFRYVTGNPYTPMTGSYSDFDSGSYTPIAAYPTNTSRLPAFHQLDLRIDHTWKFRHWSLASYLDVQNVYNQQNPEAAYYNYNYSKMGIVSGLPILPIAGVKADF